MRRLVVGCGYLGERVARVWRQAGDEVYEITRGTGAGGLSRAGLRPIVLDVTQGPRLGALPDVDTVLFAVGRARRSGATMFDLHVKGLRAVLDALPGSTGRMIYASSTGVYAQNAGEWVDEESVCEPVVRGERRACQRSGFSSPTRAGAMRSCCGWQGSTGQGGYPDRATSPRAADCRFARCGP